MDSLRRRQLDEALAARILVLDGAMATMVQARHPTTADYGGPGQEGCTENLCHTRPDWILEIHRAYLDAGADIISTDSFQGSPIVLAGFGLDRNAGDLNLAAARLARQAADECSTTLKPRFVAGSLGPAARPLTGRRDVTFAQLTDSYDAQARALVDGGVDLLLIETACDLRNVRAALLAIQRLEQDLQLPVPVMISATIGPSGAMLDGQTLDALLTAVAHADPLSIGLNCSSGPGMMTDHIRALATMATTRISCHPSAGLPTEEGHYRETADSFATQLDELVRSGWLNIVGGCCGTTPGHIRALAQIADGRAPRIVNTPIRSG